MRFCVRFVTIVALMFAVFMPLDVALGQGGNATRILPATVQRGETFDVTVNFAAPADLFNSIALRDTAPDGWNVTVDAAWCTPNADNVKATGNRASLTWNGPYSEGTNFAVMYQVTVPCDASPRRHSFNVSPYESFLSYYIGLGDRIRESITGDYELEVGLTAIAAISHSPGNFSSTQGDSNTENKTLEIWNSGCGMLNWSVSDDAVWLSENPTSGSSTGEHDIVAVSLNTTGMATGDYSANITITAPGASNNPQIVPVSLHVISTVPEISFSPEGLTFTAVEGGPTPASETLEIWNLGIEMLNWSVSDDAAWLSENPVTGSSTGADDTTLVTVSVNTTGMSAGDYSANMTITAPGVSNSPQTVPVSLHVGEISPPPQSWINRYWWTMVAGIVAVVLLVYLLRRRRGA